jgi:hypothetical protein
MLQAAFQAYADSLLGRALKAATWAFAITEIIHLLALAVLGGTVLFAGAAALGFDARRRPAPGTIRGLRPLFRASLAVMLISGVVLVGTNPMKYYFNDAFRVKMAVLLLAIGAFAWLSVRARDAVEGQLPVDAKVAAGLSLGLWLGVGLGGRLIGLL